MGECSACCGRPGAGLAFARPRSSSRANLFGGPGALHVQLLVAGAILFFRMPEATSGLQASTGDIGSLGFEERLHAVLPSANGSLLGDLFDAIVDEVSFACESLCIARTRAPLGL